VNTLHAGFEEAARRYSVRPALTDEHGELSYAEVLDAARELAESIERHAAPGERLVALRVGRDRYAPVAMIAVLMSGRGYVPVDPQYPVSRQEYLHQDCGASLVVTDSGLLAGEKPLGTIGRFTVAARQGTIARSLPDDVAYVIYTSGSTGNPKGCAVGHANVLALLGSRGSLVETGPGDVWTLVHSLSFDVSVWELWGALLSGGTVVMVSAELKTDPELFADMLTERRVSVLCQTPPMFGSLARELISAKRSLPDLRYVLLAGEAVNPEDVTHWLQHKAAPSAEVFNVYGPTETTVYATAKRLSMEDCATATRTRTPIGRPLPHLAVSLRDDEGRVVPNGAPGEMWVSGAGVAHGYLGRPELTGERFVTDGGTRHYRTGDWVVADDEGELWFLGRRDGQVKVRGHRVELGEVEAVIAALDGVEAVAATVVENRAGHRLLAAYVVCAPGGGVDAASIRSWLRERAPEYLRPQRLARVARLPMTSNGKLDRPALPSLPTVDWEK